MYVPILGQRILRDLFRSCSFQYLEINMFRPNAVGISLSPVAQIAIFATRQGHRPASSPPICRI